jgi:hypothetical protein
MPPDPHLETRHRRRLPDGTGTRPISGSGLFGSYAIPGTETTFGTWTLTCGTSVVEIYVGEVHGQLWLDPSTSGCTYPGPMCRIVEDFTTHKPDDQWYTANSGAGRVPTLAEEDEYWVRETGWYYIMDVALPSLTADGSAKLPNRAGTAASGTGTTPTSVLGGSSPGLSYQLILTRLAVARLLAAEYNQHWDPDGVPGADDDPISDRDTDYLAALVYWVAQLDAYSSDWGATWPEGDDNDDLNRARLLMGLAAAYDLTYDALTDDQRDVWRALLVREADSLFQDMIVDGANYTFDYDYVVGSGGGLEPLRPPFRHRRAMLNGHNWEPYSALGVAAIVLDQELSGATVTKGDWHDYVSAAMADFTGYGDDGAHHNGVYYWSQETTALVAYLEAERTAGTGGVWSGETWLANNARFVQHFTFPNGQRVVFSDGGHGDAMGPSHLFGRYAATFSADDDLAQRLAWFGHNRWTGVNNARRDVFDVLWWDEGVSPMADVDWTAEHPHACFPDRGLVSTRTGWDDDPATDTNTQLAFFGGPLLGGHGDPAAGSFWMYGQGHLVTGDLDQNVKRTATQSSILVDGWGQHGDGVIQTDAVPDLDASRPPTTDTNNARLTLFLDNRGVTTDSSTVDLVTYGADLTQAYTYETGGTYPDDVTGRVNPTNVNGLPNRGSLNELARYVVWVEGQAFVYDRMLSTVGQGEDDYRFDWFLQTAHMADTTGVRAEPTETCLVDSDVNLRWRHDGPAGARYLKFRSDGLAEYTSGWSSVTVPTADVHLYEPIPLAACSASPITHPATRGTLSSYALIEPANSTGKLKVQSLDSTQLSWQYTAPGVGMLITGAHLRRSRIGDGYFLTSLRPYTSTEPTSLTANAGSTNGKAFTYDIGAKAVTALFASVGGSAVSDSSSNQVTGRYGVVVHGQGQSYTTRYAAQLVRGTDLQHRGTGLIHTSSSTMSVGVTWTSSSSIVRAWGVVEYPPGLPPVPSGATVTIYVPGLTGTVYVDTVDGTQTVTAFSGYVAFTADWDTTFRIRTGSTSSVTAFDTCF